MEIIKSGIQFLSTSETALQKKMWKTKLLNMRFYFVQFYSGIQLTPSIFYVIYRVIILEIYVQ